MAEILDIFTHATRGVATGKHCAGEREQKQNFNGTFHLPCLQNQAQRALRLTSRRKLLHAGYVFAGAGIHFDHFTDLYE